MVEASQAWRHNLVEVVEVEGVVELEFQEQVEEEVGHWDIRKRQLKARPLELLQTGFYRTEVQLPAH